MVKSYTAENNKKGMSARTYKSVMSFTNELLYGMITNTIYFQCALYLQGTSVCLVKERSQVRLFIPRKTTLSSILKNIQKFTFL